MLILTFHWKKMNVVAILDHFYRQGLAKKYLALLH